MIRGRRRPGPALLGALGAVVLVVLLGFGLRVGPILAADPSPGPPFPPPEPNRAVYDQAEILSPETEAWAEATIDAIEERTGAEVVVYTQVVPPSTTTEDAEAPSPSSISGGSGAPGSTTASSCSSTSIRTAATARSSSTPDPASEPRI